jgi:hypothetical protein
MPKPNVLAILILLLAQASCSARLDLSDRIRWDHVCPSFDMLVRPTVHTSNLTGRLLVDTEALPVSGARVTLRPLGGTESVRVATTGPDGSWSMLPVSPGLYQLETCVETIDSTVTPIRFSRVGASSPLVIRTTWSM